MLNTFSKESLPPFAWQELECCKDKMATVGQFSCITMDQHSIWTVIFYLEVALKCDYLRVSACVACNFPWSPFPSLTTLRHAWASSQLLDGVMLSTFYLSWWLSTKTSSHTIIHVSIDPLATQLGWLIMVDSLLQTSFVVQAPSLSICVVCTL